MDYGLSWETWFKIENILEDESWHFVLSSISGFVVFLLILTIFGGVLWSASLMSHSHVSATKGAKRFIVFLALAFGLLAVWLSHIALDWFVVWWNTPLSPHLPLILK